MTSAARQLVMPWYHSRRSGRPKRVFTPEEILILQKLFEEGHSWAGAAVMLGTSIPTLQREALTHGLHPIEQAQEARRATLYQRRDHSSDGVLHTHYNVLVEMALARRTLQEIADVVGVTRERVRQVLNKLGLNTDRKLGRLAGLRNVQRLTAAEAALINQRGQLWLEAAYALTYYGWSVWTEAGSNPRVLRPMAANLDDVTFEVRLHWCTNSYLSNQHHNQRYYHAGLLTPDRVHVVATSDGRRFIYYPFPRPRNIFIRATPRIYIRYPSVGRNTSDIAWHVVDGEIVFLPQYTKSVGLT